MKATTDPRPPVARVKDEPLMLEAMRQGVREALLRHKRAGNSVAVWRDGAVAWIPPEEIEVDEAPAEGAPSRA